jgi:hypothetical protein
MNRRFGFLLVVIACVVLFPFRAPAPLFYVPGEGWYYESYGQNAKWQRPRAKEQLDVAEQAFAKKTTTPRSMPRTAFCACGRCRTTRRTRNISLAAAWSEGQG